MIKAIETSWNGLVYRSRLEATWAVFLNGWNLQCEYEPFDGDRYLPDFALLGRNPLLVEIKPILTTWEADKHKLKVRDGTRSLDYDVLILGATPFLKQEETDEFVSVVSHDRQIAEPAGLVLQPHSGWSDEDWFPAYWVWCADCNGIALHTPDASWSAYPCGHHDKHYRHILSPELVLPVWREAKNVVRWMPKKGAL
jgi:hypothetical protein